MSKEWIRLKENERLATEARRELEDKMLSFVKIHESFEGTKNIEHGIYSIKIVGRLNKKIDSDKLQELAIEHGLTEHLSSLFRWKPEINVAIWKSAAEVITNPLLEAITTVPGRASFSINIKE